MRFRVPTVALACALSVAVIGPARSPAHADEEERRQQIDRSLAAARDDLQETSQELSTALAQLRRAEADLARARETALRARRQLAAAQAAEGALSGRLEQSRRTVRSAQLALDGLTARATQTRAGLARIARSAYQQGTLSEVAVYLRAETPEDLLARLAYTRSALRNRDALLTDLAEQRVALGERQAVVRAQQAETARLQAAAAANVTRMHRLEAQLLAWQRGAVTVTAVARRARAALQRERAAEAGRIADMERESQALRSRLAVRDRTRGSWVGDGTETLTRPALGAATSPFGVRRHPITGVDKMHDGTDFGGGCNSPVYAAASGFVLDSRYSEGWGNRLEVDHGVKRGESVAAAYNHLARLLVRAGDYVYRGQVIATMGNTGLSTGCHLHFTVYADGDPADPMRWL